MSKFEKIIGTNLTPVEAVNCRAAYETALAQEDGALHLLEEHFPNAQEIYEEILRGVEDFHALMEADMRSQDAVRSRLAEAISEMTPAEQARHLLNMLVSLSVSSSREYGCDAWDEDIASYENLLSAAESEKTDEEYEAICAGLFELVLEHIDQTSMLMIDFDALEEAAIDAQEEGRDEIPVFAHSKEAGVCAAAALYTLYATGNLSSLGEQAVYTPYSMGVSAAFTLETDASFKTNADGAVNPRLVSAARTAAMLLTFALSTAGILLVSYFGMKAILAILAIAPDKALMIAGTATIALEAIQGTAPDLANLSVQAGNAAERFVTASVPSMLKSIRAAKDHVCNVVLPRSWMLWNKGSQYVEKLTSASPAAVSEQPPIQTPPSENTPISVCGAQHEQPAISV